MANWSEAGRKAWATRQLNDARYVRDLYRRGFDNAAKRIARRRVAEVLRAAGGTRCLDAWGGGISAVALKQVGLAVISVEDGSFELSDYRGSISAARKRRALEFAAAEDGYEARWGKLAKFASEADVAFLDFCGPWTKDVANAVQACRHMKAITVTLTTDHDINTDATTQSERLVMYQSVLKLRFSDGTAQGRLRTPCRLLCHYRRPTGQPVWVFLLARRRLPIKPLSTTERNLMEPRARKAYDKARYERLKADPEWVAQNRARVRAWTDANRERQRTSNRASYARMKARQAEAE